MATLTGQLSETELDAALKALASVQRREIVRMLGTCESQQDTSCCGADEICACTFSEQLGLSASTVSHHMTVLREAGLVSGRKDGTWVYYRLNRDALGAIAETLRDL